MDDSMMEGHRPIHFIKHPRRRPLNRSSSPTGDKIRITGMRSGVPARARPDADPKKFIRKVTGRDRISEIATALDAHPDEALKPIKPLYPSPNKMIDANTLKTAKTS